MSATHHNHFILDAVISEAPTSERWAKALLVKIIKAIGMQVAKLSNNQPNPTAWYCQDKDNEGMTAIGVLTTSHISLHIWDRMENPELHFDLYSCSDFNIDYILKVLHANFKIKSGVLRFIDRKNNKDYKYNISVFNGKIFKEEVKDKRSFFSILIGK